MIMRYIEFTFSWEICSISDSEPEEIPPFYLIISKAFILYKG